MGKHKYIETPEKLLELFEKYKANLKPREIQKATPRGVVSEFHTPPLTMAGFEVFCYNEVGTVDHYFNNSNDAYSDYCTICSYIKKEIRKDQIEGGMVGQYNASITQRLNSLTERVDTTTQGEKVNSVEITIVPPNEDTK
jgi:hypothetical protein